ncbi:uncharacterized protein PV09_00851 [Verruconis gallopava]|uniref:PH domain-containing protein n=1 Tax=Verruconis gallopava TaxID=253628 RepID=A0A0D2AR05_9PEZI|nr:uncharacterized protein PV09_00851 [Verruconis gallopava]KIW08935.1 hypothetical protein PV09_00851 [Verruconis gallopava]
MLPTGPSTIRRLGHAILCGALHVAFETADKVRGCYSICVLYRSSLVLATVGSNCGVYQIEAIVPLLNASLEAPDSGRGLQCYTAPYTWKLIFLYEQKYYELLMSACSEQEEKVWINHLTLRIAAESRDAAEGRHSDNHAHIAMNIKPLSAALEQHGDMIRNKSIRRAATLGPRLSIHQVIIKNTYARTPGRGSEDGSIRVSRSKSHMSSTHMFTLAPRRSERVRLEGILADVWSRDSLPYPGMATRRPENGIRASANSVMRKLSMASIASNFSSKRSGSFGNSSTQRPESGRTPSPRAFYSMTSKGRRLKKRCSRAAVVDFHTAPAAFLPEDFELKRPTLAVRSQNFVRRAMTMETCKTASHLHFPQSGQENKQPASIFVSTDFNSPTLTPLQSSESGCLSDIRPATTKQGHPGTSLPLKPSAIVTKAPIKVKSRLFKLLRVHNKNS